MDPESLDIVIVGAGLSGINSAYRVQTELPGRSFAVLEARHEIGGTWSFWRYPGIRSDSAMGVFGFAWRPWPHDDNIARGPAIRAYLEQCAAAEGIDARVRLGHRVVAARWCSAEQRWTLHVDVTAPAPGGGGGAVTERRLIKAWWVVWCSGYYSYDKALPAVIPGIDRFAGRVVHPQFWDDAVDCAGKRVVIVGSGATAVTLLPALAETAESVTMLQRSPSYLFSVPWRSGLVASLSRFMPVSWAAKVHWWRQMITETLFVQFLLAFPGLGRRLLTALMRRQLPAGFDVDTHFSPRYNPFEQRLCFCPGGDFFRALRRSRARVVTDTVDTVTETGIRLASGATLDADVIVTATGLYFSLFSGVSITVDGDDRPVTDTLGRRYVWNGTMLEGVPNAGLIIGYTAATWTPGADVRVRQLIKVIRHMDRRRATSATPTVDPAERPRLPAMPAVGLSSTYLVSAHDRMPKIAGVGPWTNGGSWVADAWRLMFSNVTKGMRYTFASTEPKKDA